MVRQHTPDMERHQANIIHKKEAESSSEKQKLKSHIKWLHFCKTKAFLCVCLADSVNLRAKMNLISPLNHLQI